MSVAGRSSTGVDAGKSLVMMTSRSLAYDPTIVVRPSTVRGYITSSPRKHSILTGSALGSSISFMTRS